MVKTVRNTIQLPCFLSVYYVLYDIYTETMFPSFYMYLYTQANANISLCVTTDFMYVCTRVHVYKNIYTPTNAPFFFGTHSMSACLVYLSEKSLSAFHPKSKINNNKISTEV